MSCYAYSFDAIARATDAEPDLSDLFSTANADKDPNYAEGLKRFRSCTTRDWVVEGFDIAGNPIIEEGDIPAGPVPWVNIVNYFARLGMQTNTQHLYGSFDVTVRGRRGTVTAYAIITTYTTDGDMTTMSTATSTYTSDVVYKRGKWLLKKTTFVNN